MSRAEKQALENNFDNWRNERVPGMPRDKAFELYCVEQILKHYELTDEEIRSGLCGKQDDGGADGIYLFADKTLLTEETPLPKAISVVTLAIIQSTLKDAGYSEKRMDRFYSLADDIFDYQKSPEQLTHLEPQVVGLISNFRVRYSSLAAKKHTFNVVFYYAANIDRAADQNHKLESRFQKIKAVVTEAFSHAIVTWEPWGSARLLQSAREEPESTLNLPVTDGKVFLTRDGGAICVTRLSDFKTFITHEDGTLNTRILEPNVRDYQGSGNPVNTAIKETLRSDTEFWWLNNGVTILAEDCQHRGDVLTLTKPEIVNGLQTSHEIFNYFSERGDKEDLRWVMVKVIKPTNERVETKIIRSTNYQTPVPSLVLHSTEPIHLDIEDLLRTHGLFYDRKKGKYKRLGKRVSDIVSVLDVARAVIAIVRRKPDTARARPQTLLNIDSEYEKVFNVHCDRNLYLVCVLLDRRVASTIREHSSLLDKDVRYYVGFWLICKIVKSATPTDKEIASSLQAVKDLSDQDIHLAAVVVMVEYQKLGGTEQVAKGPHLRDKLQSLLAELYSQNSR